MKIINQTGVFVQSFQKINFKELQSLFSGGSVFNIFVMV